MTEHPNPQQQRQKLESYQEQLLQQYSELFEDEESVYQTAEQALNDRLANAKEQCILRTTPIPQPNYNALFPFLL